MEHKNKNMKNVLVKLKEVYLDYVRNYKVVEGRYVENTCVGLCFSSKSFLTIEEDELFQKYLTKYKKRRKVFYDYTNEKVKDDTQFLWNPKDVQVRLDWLDKQIEKLSKESTN